MQDVRQAGFALENAVNVAHVDDGPLGDVTGRVHCFAHLHHGSAA